MILEKTIVAIVLIALLLLFILIVIKNNYFTEKFRMLKLKTLLLKKKDEEARKFALKIVEKYPRNYLAHKILGELYEKEGKLTVALDEYINDLKTKSECPETVSTNDLNLSKMEKQPPEKVAALREEFDDTKAKLRKEWESENGREWPKYTEDIYNDSGQIIRRKGDNYDAHHIQPLCLGGENTASNITPLDIYSHRDIHSSNGSCKNLVNVLGGNS